LCNGGIPGGEPGGMFVHAAEAARTLASAGGYRECQAAEPAEATADVPITAQPI
jgi:hypothetical protein